MKNVYTYLNGFDYIVRSFSILKTIIFEKLLIERTYTLK